MHRRNFVKQAGILGLGMSPLAALAQAGAGDLRLLQCVDTAAEQTELTRDYMVGVQLAAQAINQNGGINGRTLRIAPIQMDSSPAGLQSLVQRLRSDPEVLGIVGSVGESLADATVQATRAANLPIAHIAPWIGHADQEADPNVLHLFASRDMQMRAALKNLEPFGITRIGVVFDSPATHAANKAEFAAAAQRMSVEPLSFVAAEAGGVEALARTMPASSPAVLCFVGGSIELSRFAHAIATRGLQRYIVNLGDANLALLTQLGATKATPMVLTQVVPNPFSDTKRFSRDYRSLLKKFTEEDPSPMSLAGYLAGRYTVKLLARLEKPTRAAVLEEVRRRPAADLEGYHVAFGPGRLRGSTLVAQTMVSRDGRMIG